MKTFPKAGSELRTAIGDNGLGNTMEANDPGEIQFRILLHGECSLDGKKMRRFGKSINNDPNGIIPLRSLGKSSNEIHANVLPFPRWNGQWLQCSSRLEMFDLHLLANIAFSNISSDFPLHPSPPKLLFEVLIHLGTTWVDRE